MVQNYKVFYKYHAIEFISLANSSQTGDKHTHTLISPDNIQILAAINSCFATEEKIKVLHILTEKPKEDFDNFIEKLPKIYAAGGIVTNGSHEWLFIKRAGVWDLPKGKIDVDETVECAAIRELREETGIKSVSIIKSLDSSFHLYHEHNELVFKHVSWFLMLGTKSKLKPQAEEKITEARWLDKEAIRKIYPHIFPSLRQVIQQAGIFFEKN